jgi:hypothetical protein
MRFMRAHHTNRSDSGALKTRVSAARHVRVGLHWCARQSTAHREQPMRGGVERRDAWRIRAASE